MRFFRFLLTEPRPQGLDWIMFRYNMIFQTPFIFKEYTALGIRLRNPNEES